MHKIVIFAVMISFFGVSLCLAQETLTITTYYPSPYGVYNELRTYGFTYLATNSGSVGIGTTTPGLAGKFEVNMGNNNNFFRVNQDNNVSVELRSGTSLGTPYIDFSNDPAIDFDVRLVLTGNDTLALQGGTHDIAEYTPSDGTPEPGDVVVIDQANEFRVTKSTHPYDTLVAGVYSEEPGFLFGEKEGKYVIPLALAGRVKTKATAENGPIAKGDLLITSSKPGYTMKCDDKLKCIGAVVGKALESLESGEGKILVLVALQ